jgi:cysteine-rich repeat protein
VIGTGMGYIPGIEQCDDDNSIDGDGCASDCSVETPVCDDFDFALNPTSADTGSIITAQFTSIS